MKLNKTKPKFENDHKMQTNSKMQTYNNLDLNFILAKIGKHTHFLMVQASGQVGHFSQVDP